jgi:uncharacterized membrane protein YecN with MAPEG domain
MLSFLKNFTEYIPFILISLIFIAEAEIETHAFKTSCNLCITIISLVVFYAIYFNIKNNNNNSKKIIACIISIITWIILVYVRKNHLIQ